MRNPHQNWKRVFGILFPSVFKCLVYSGAQVEHIGGRALSINEIFACVLVVNNTIT